ncbi:MAG: carboxypeptidase regulatory-like domain-containing protein [Holophagales bacterium]|nr:carboxypeptidase regulatory-like domain-containing protein [Holophagales bacterium]
MTRSSLVVALLGSFLVLRASGVSAGSLSGTVVVDGRPAAGAVVSAIPFEEPLEKARRQLRGEAEPKALSSATAGPGGAFALSIPAVPGKESWFRVRITAKGAVAAEAPGVFDASETDDLGELALRKAEALAGRVTGPGGKPVSGARVTLTARGRFDARFDLTPAPEVTTTGEDGTFRFAGAASERNELVFEAAGLAPVRVADAKGGAQSRAIVLAAGTPLAGSVKKSDGKPAAGVLVRFEADGLETGWVETGADGVLVLPDLPSRRGSVVADAGEAGFAQAVSITPGPGRAALRLVLAPPTVLQGRTLDVATLKAVPRVKLALGAAEGVRVARSGADGRYRLRAVRPGDASVQADEPRYVPWYRPRVLLEKGATKVLDIPLTRGATLSGRVLDENGRPVAEAKVVVSLGGEGQGRFRLAAQAFASDRGAKIRSREDGTFSATRLPHGENQRVTAEHPEYEKGKVGGISLQPGETRTGAVVALRRGLVVTGTVKDPEGNPIAGAELTLSPSRVVRSSRGGMRMQMAFGGLADAPTARSGADGRFELKGVAAGDWGLTAKSPGRATEVVDPVKLVRDARPDPIDIVLSPGASIAGFVLRKTGGGVEGYTVVPRPSGGSAAGNFGSGARPTGPDGGFVLDGLKAGETYDLQLFGGASMGPGPAKKGIVAPAANVEWIIEGAGRIEGVAVDGRTGQPLTSFEISYQTDRFGGSAMMSSGRRPGGRGTGRVGDPVVVEAPDGRFVLEDVPAGKWLVGVAAKGYQAGRAAGVVVEEATTTDGVEIRVAPGSTLKVRVTDAKSGRGVPEAQVGAIGEAGGSSFQSGELVTDVDGRLEVEGLAPGRTKVSVSHADYTDRTESVDLKEGGSSVEVALSRGSSLGGVVLSETRQPVPGAEVALEGANAPGRGFGSGGGESATTDASGRFRFDHLAPGRYTLGASVPAQAAEPVEAIVVAGESKDDVVLVLAGGATIRGVVSGLSETLRAGVGVNASGPREYGASARTGADGRFELSGAPAGTISLRATAGDFFAGATRSASGSVTIAEGQKEAEAEIVFEGTGALSGRVTRGGSPVPEARLFLGGPRGASSGSGRTDESGSYRIEGLTPGDYTVNVQAAAGGGRGVSKEIRIDGEASLDVELPMARLFGIVVDGSTKQPLADARVTANLDGGSSSRPGFASSDSNGRFFVDDVEPGAYTLTLRRSGYQEASDTVSATEAGGDAGTIEMTRGEGLELRVRDGIYQIPLRSANVRVRDGAGATVTSTWLSLDGDGKGEISSLRPGRYTLVLASSGYATQVLEGIVVPGAPLPVALTPGGSVEVKPGEASRAKGEATLRNALGQPHPYRSWGTEGRVPLPAAGTQLLENLAPGSYTLAVDGAAPKGFTVTEGGRTAVELP